MVIKGQPIERVRLWAMSVIILGVTNAVLGLVGAILLIPVLPFAASPSSSSCWGWWPNTPIPWDPWIPGNRGPYPIPQGLGVPPEWGTPNGAKTP